MILKVTVEVWDKAGEPSLVMREIQIEAEADILFVPGVSQAAQSVTGKALTEARKEIERKASAAYVAAGKRNAPS